MPDGPTAEDRDVPARVDSAAFERLQREVTDLRLQIRGEVRTGRLVVVDEAGIARARLTVEGGGDCRLVLLDEDGFERISLKCLDEVGSIEVAGRSRSGEATRAAGRRPRSLRRGRVCGRPLPDGPGQRGGGVSRLRGAPG